MTNLSRRTMLSAGLTAAAYAALAPGPARAGTRPDPELFGTAAVSAAIVGMTLTDDPADSDTAYLVTRGQTPPKVVTVDLGARAVRAIGRLPRGDGGWAATVSGGKVYVGTYPQAELFEYDPTTQSSTLIGKLASGTAFVWCLTTAPDGTVYAGTSPGSGVWEYSPATGALRNLGRAHPTIQYARVIAADDRFVYVGTTPEMHLVRFDRSSGERTEIQPPEVSGPGAFYAIQATGDRVVASFGGGVLDVAPDGSDPKVLLAPDPEPVDALTVTPEGDLYCISRRKGTVLRRVGDALEPIGLANVGDETRALVSRPDGNLIGCGGSGVLWYRDMASGDVELFDLADTDVAGPDLIQSVSLDPGRAVYVGGHYSVTEHKPWKNTDRRFRVAGEAKAMLPLRGKVIATLYPSSEVIELDPTDGSVRSFGFTGFQRPWEIVHDEKRNLALIASAPGSGIRTGGLSILDLATGELTNHPEVLPDQAVVSVAVVGRIAYLAGDTWGGGSVTPTLPTSQIAAFDIPTRKVLWRTDGLPESPSLQHIDVHDNVLYGVYKRPSGGWFAMDLSTRKVLHQGKLSGYGEIVVHRDQVFAATNFADNIYRIGPNIAEAELLVGSIPTSWFTVPQLEFEPKSWHAWGAADRQLARFDLSPHY